MSTSGTKENHSNSLSGTGSVNVDSTATRSSILSPLCEDADSGIKFLSYRICFGIILLKNVDLSVMRLCG